MKDFMEVNYEGRGQGRPHPDRDRREQEGSKGAVWGLNG